MTNYFTTDYLIIYAFLITTLVVGCQAGRGIKDIRDYAIANKTFGTAALVLTFLATDVGGGFILDDTACVFSDGVIMTAAVLGIAITYLIRALFIAPHMVYFDDCLTMGDIMERLYGMPGKLLAGVLGVITAAIIAAMQLIVAGALGESLLGINSTGIVCVSGIVVAAYAAHGGIRAVTVTDIFQFLVLIVGIPLIASTAVSHAGGLEEVFQKVLPEKLVIFQHEKFSFYLTIFLAWGVLSIGMIDPAIVQRMLMGKQKRQLRNQFLIIAAFDPALRIALMFTGLAGLALYPNIEAQSVVPHIIQELLPTGVKGLALAGILGALISTADSYLHATGLTIARDIAKPIYARNGVTIDELLWARGATLVAGFVAILVGLQSTKIMDLAFIAAELSGPLLIFPLVSGVIGVKTDQRSFYAAIVATITAFVVSKAYLSAELSHLTILICTIANGIAFFGVHVWQHGGVMFVDRVSEERREIVWYPQSKNFWEMIDSLIPTPERVLHSSQESVRKYGAPYVLFGTFCCISFTVPYFMWSYEALQEQALMMCLRIIGGVLCGLLIVGDKWPKKLVPHIPIFWHGTLLYCLPFISTVMFLLTNGSVEWLVNVGITLLFLIVLVDWFTFLVLTMLGVALGILFYSLAIGPVNLQLDFSTQYLLIYQAFFATVIGLLFARRRQQRFDYALEQTEDMNITQKLTQQKLLEAFQDKIKILRALKYAGTHELLEVAKMTRELRMYLQANNAPLQTVAAQVETLIIPMVMQLGGVADKALHYVRMNTDMISIMDLLTGVQGRLAKEGKYKNVQVRIRTKHKSLECDPKYIQDLLVDSVQILQKEHGGLPSIIITIEDAKLHYPLPSVGKGYVKNIKALRITVSTQDAVLSSERNYTVDMSTPLQYEDPQNNWELACFEIQRIVKSHYGYTNALTADTLSYALPLHVREVRPKDLDRPHMELGVAPVRANDQYPGAQETERAFLEAVQKHSKADIETVKTILELIKWYHGAVNRKSGEPFYLHPVSVAQIVLEYDTDEATVLGALLHDTVEDTAMLLQDIESVFGTTTTNIVDKVTHLESGKGTFYKLTLATEENMAMLAEAGDDRAICVKLADRMHNMRTIKAKPYEKQLRTAKETLQYYVPHAERLGLHNAVREFKERCYDVINNKPEGI